MQYGWLQNEHKNEEKKTNEEKNVKGKNNTEIKGAKKKTISKMKHISNRNSKCL